MAGLCQFILALPQAQHPHILLLDDKTRFSKVPPLCEETMCDTVRLPMAFDFRNLYRETPRGLSVPWVYVNGHCFRSPGLGFLQPLESRVHSVSGNSSYQQGQDGQQLLEMARLFMAGLCVSFQTAATKCQAKNVWQKHCKPERFCFDS